MQSKVILSTLLALSIGLSAHAQENDEHSETTEETAKTHSCCELKRNVLAIAPIQFSENGLAGVGLSYERVLDKGGIISLYVPASFVMRTGNNNRYDYYGNTIRNADPMFYLMPGVKIYPTGSNGLAKYAIGPSLVVAAGQRTQNYDDRNYYYYDPNNIRLMAPQYYNVTRDRFLLGMMVNQSLNINPSPHLYMGAEFGFGFTYLNMEDGVSQGTDALVQFNFKIGYRF